MAGGSPSPGRDGGGQGLVSPAEAAETRRRYRADTARLALIVVLLVIAAPLMGLASCAGLW